MSRAGGLSTSDRIVEVDGVRLDSTDHEKAVAAIQVGMMMFMMMIMMMRMMEVVILMRRTKTTTGGTGRDHLHGAELA